VVVVVKLSKLKLNLVVHLKLRSALVVKIANVVLTAIALKEIVIAVTKIAAAVLLLTQ
jgi:hypothetical protein